MFEELKKVYFFKIHYKHNWNALYCMKYFGYERDIEISRVLQNWLKNRLN